MTLGELITKEKEYASEKRTVEELLRQLNVSTHMVRLYIGNYSGYFDNTEDRAVVLTLLNRKLTEVSIKHKKYKDKLTLLEQLINN